MLRGDETKENRNVFIPPSVYERVTRIVRSQWDTTSAPTQTSRDAYGWAADAFATELGRLNAFASELEAFERQLEAGSLKIIDFFHEVRVLEVPREELERVDPEGCSIWNLNTPEDFQRAEALLKERAGPNK